MSRHDGLHYLSHVLYAGSAEFSYGNINGLSEFFLTKSFGEVLFKLYKLLGLGFGKIIPAGLGVLVKESYAA